MKTMKQANGWLICMSKGDEVKFRMSSVVMIRDINESDGKVYIRVYLMSGADFEISLSVRDTKTFVELLNTF